MPSCNESEPWRPLGSFLDLYLLPFVCIVGLLLNIACLIVFTKRNHEKLILSPFTLLLGPSPKKESARRCSPPDYERRDSFNTRHQREQRRSHPLVPALIVLSLCDSLQLLFSIFVLYVPAVHDFLELDPHGIVAQIAYIATGTLAGGLLASNCASIWTMCYISIQRHQAIVRPLSTVNASQNTSFLPLLFISMMALVFNVPIWFEFTWYLHPVVRRDGSTTWFLKHKPSELFFNEKYQFLMKKVLYPIVVYLLPLVVISVLNMRILSNISYKRLHSIGHKRRMAKEKRSVMLLISIVVLFFVCHTGGLVIRFFDFHKYGNSACFIFAKDLINFLFNINSFANPMLYFFFTKQFADLKTTWVSNGTSNSVTKRLLKTFSSKSNESAKILKNSNAV